MSKRKIININASKCNGCGLCLPNCPEGAIQLVDGKARLISDLSCDGLGACLGHCPEGAITIEEREVEPFGKSPSALRQWPVQLHLVPPKAAYFQGKDVVLAADCVAYALGNFHPSYLKGNALAIACPKLDAEQESYMEKLTQMIDQARINTLTVMVMEVPCCSGLLRLAKSAREKSMRKIPLKAVVVSLQGDIVSEDWV